MFFLFTAWEYPVPKEITLMDSATSTIIDHFIIQLPKDTQTWSNSVLTHDDLIVKVPVEEGDIPESKVYVRVKKHLDNYRNIYSYGSRYCRTLSDLFRR